MKSFPQFRPALENQVMIHARLRNLVAGGWVLVAASLAPWSIGRGQQPEEAVETVTEAENVPRQSEQAPDEAQGLPAKGAVERNADADLTGRSLSPSAPLDRGQLRRRTGGPLDFDGRFAPGMFGFQVRAGEPNLQVESVRAGSAAADIGLRAGDRIVSLGNIKITTSDALLRALVVSMRDEAGDKHLRVPLIVDREGVQQTLYLDNDAVAHAGYGQLLHENGHYVPPRYVTAFRGPPEARTGAAGVEASPAARNEFGERAYLGVQLDPQFSEAAIVLRVVPGSPAAQVGLREGDRIWGINTERVESTNDLLLVISNMSPGEEIKIHFDRPHSAVVRLTGNSGEKPQSPPPGAAAPAESAPSQPAPAPNP
jgi:membrane-associated protease RseP (regulator of RpoE activity)